ncbi:hypothetical protein KSP40_PGU000177 [Platanthera guangdongensis]|uniref:Uncharacterized protein n=1 Tax=Platanthera guangdongensis TaxID=2320717 RepID=A0ABR2LGI2_9ASPA
MSSIAQQTELYPQQFSTKGSHSNDSYGPAFAVLAVIAVLAISACIIGRICAHRIWRMEAGGGSRFSRGDNESRLPSSIQAGKLAKGKPEASWRGGLNGEHAEIKAGKEQHYAGLKK